LQPDRDKPSKAIKTNLNIFKYPSQHPNIGSGEPFLAHLCSKITMGSLRQSSTVHSISNRIGGAKNLFTDHFQRRTGIIFVQPLIIGRNQNLNTPILINVPINVPAKIANESRMQPKLCQAIDLISPEVIRHSPF